MDEQLLFDPAKMKGGPAHGVLVYHYTSYHVASSFILDGECQLLANTVRKMNDPMEHIAKFLLGGASVDLEHDEVMRIHAALKTASYENARLLCCSLDTPADTLDHPDGLITRKPGRRGFGHPAMWAHYGENHNGVCLIFHRQKLDATVNRNVSGLTVKSSRVSYDTWASDAVVKNKSTAGPDQKDATDDQLAKWASSQIEARYKDLFFVKHDDWAPEAEFRWLILGERSSDLFIKLDGDELAGVIVGSDFPLSLHEPLSKLCDNWNVPVRTMMWWNGESAHPWSLKNDSDPDHIKEFWNNRELEASRRRTM